MATDERFREVTADTVTDAERDAAEHTLRCVSHALGLPASIRLRWFRPLSTIDESIIQRHGGTAPWHTFTSDERTAGRMTQSNRSEIWIRADRGPLRVANTVAHELRHVWQVPKYGYLSDASTDTIVALHATIEADAYEFAATAVEILVRGAA